MNPQEINFKERYQPLSRKVDDYNDVQSALKEAYELTKKVKEEIDKETKKNKNSVKNYNDYDINNFGVNRVDDLNKLYNKFLLEYSELENNIKKSLENDQKISKEERLQIIFELSDIVNLAEEKGIKERKNFASTFGNLWKGTDTKDIKEKSLNLRDKDIDDYSPEEAVAAMKYLSQNYNNFTESKVNVSVLNNNIDSLDDKYEVRKFQDKLSEKIFGEGKEFNDNYILGFSNDKGNYIVDIKDFEKNSKDININNINSRLLVNYLSYLNSKDALNATGLNNRFNKKFLEDLSKNWNNDSYSSTAKKLLEEKGILKSVIESILINKKDTEELSPIVDIAKKIETQDNEYFLKHPEQIILLKNGEKVKNILNLIGDKKILGNKRIDLTNINPDLRNENSIFLNKNIELDFDDFGLIDIKIIESNFDKIISKLKKFDGGTQIEIFLMKAAQKGINKEILSKGIEKHKIKINDTFLYIKYYLGEVEGVSKESFDKIKDDTKNFENFDPAKVSDKDSYIITNYILNNIDDDNIVKIFRTLINKNFFGKNAEFFFMGGNLKSSIELVKRDPAYLVFIPEEFRGNKLIINEILSNKKVGFNEKMGIIQEANLTNINSVLMIYKFFTENTKDKNNFIKTFLSYPKIGNTIFNSINKNNGENVYIDAENIKIYEELKKLLIDNKHILNQYYNELMSMKKATIDYEKNSLEYKNKEEFKIKFLNDLSEKYKNSGIPSIIEETFKDKEIDESSIQDLYINLLNNKDKLPKDKKIEEIFKEIARELKNFKLESAKRGVSDIRGEDLKGINDELKIKDSEGIDTIDFEKLNDLFSNEIKGKTKNEIEKIKIDFIKKYGKESNQETKIRLKKALDDISDAVSSELTENNTEEYIKYIQSGSRNGFIEYAKENKIELKDSNNEIINLTNNKLDDNSIIKTNEYEYNNETGSLKIGKENIDLTENEQKNIAKNEIARENIVNFYKFFEELNLLSVWKYRNELMTSIGDININQNDGDSIKKEELRKFGNKILTFIKNIENKNNGINKKENVDLASINSVNQSLRSFSGANSSFSDTRKFNSYGDDKFGNLMRNYGIIGGAYFHINEFRKYI